MKKLFFSLVLLWCAAGSLAQTDSLSLARFPWKASWIAVPGQSANGYGVYLFRKKIDIAQVPAHLNILVSADNRYKLFVNDSLASLGPARGDLSHWKYETVDIAPWLKSGVNIVAAKVWNEGQWRPEYQISLRTGFIVQGADESASVLDTDTSWRCTVDSSYKPIKVHIPTYYVAGPGENINMNFHKTGWAAVDYDDHAWSKAERLENGVPKNFSPGTGIPGGWMLVPAGIPAAEMRPERLLVMRRAVGIQPPPGFPEKHTPFVVPANTTATILLDQTYLTNAYPSLRFSEGKNATISLAYAESLFTQYPVKENRDEIQGKIFVGRMDSIISNGQKDQEFTALSFRTYRYLQLQVTTKDTPLTIDDLYGTFTGYPFAYNANLTTDDTLIDKILKIGWRTARLCAVETYTDCPYYEQLQYIGDSRIQAMVSLYNSGDDRLLKNALNQMDQSRQPEGVTLSRHPSFSPQYIPTFSLWFIGIIRDYMMYGNDSNFVKEKLGGVREVLRYFQKYQQADGSLKGVPYWMFTDWVDKKEWETGVAPIGKDGNSSILDFQLLWAYEEAAELENVLGMKPLATAYLNRAAQLKETIRRKYWDASRNLFADRTEKDFFSQHANTLAILTGTVNPTEAAAIGKLLQSDTSLAPASIYFKYYLHLALVKAGYGDHYLSWLDIWRKNVALGLTTWAEDSQVESARSDCHAWGASPNIEVFRTVLGIDSDAPGFAKVKIEPHLGDIKNISGEIPHPKGKIAVDFSSSNGKRVAVVKLPPTITGRFVWKGKSTALVSGNNKILLP